MISHQPPTSEPSFNALAHQFLITRIEQRVVLQQESPAQAVFFQQFDLPERCQEKILVRNIHRTRLGLANEINNIHDAGRPVLPPAPRQATKHWVRPRTASPSTTPQTKIRFTFIFLNSNKL